jgi:hypothetical protein
LLDGNQQSLALQNNVIYPQVWVRTQNFMNTLSFVVCQCVLNQSQGYRLFLCLCCSHITCMSNVVGVLDIWLQWDLGLWWWASSPMTTHIKTNSTSSKLFPFIYDFFSNL